MENFNLTPDQQKETASRVVSDSELIKGGAEYNEQGGLEVTEDQINQAKLEMHGESFENVEEYIRFNKKILIPANEIPKGWEQNDITKNKVKPLEAWLADSAKGSSLKFIDSEGNLAGLDKFRFDQIKSLGATYQEARKMFVQELEKMGFNIHDAVEHKNWFTGDSIIWDDIINIVNNRKKLEDEKNLEVKRNTLEI